MSPLNQHRTPSCHPDRHHRPDCEYANVLLQPANAYVLTRGCRPWHKRHYRTLQLQIFFYVGSNATVPEYVGTDLDGSHCLLDISSNALAADRVALALTSGESLVFSQDGMHHFGAACNSASSVAIGDFLDRMVSITRGLDESAGAHELWLRATLPPQS